ncbi:hypothetical protein LPJ64_000195 [Coemansia asiatica]|uniref:WD40 repeat-like protein n=1 Tax=Coemansia asiatica TaxID=1052880 RepID=A0A9W7XNE1_9FUNG|nr:hypothetical protein LPJ64_000195 [Coemansia asiatica]
MVNLGDFVASDEEIDIEMFDSDTELSKSAKVSHNNSSSALYKPDNSDSDFMSTEKTKRGSTGSKRGRGRGKGRGASSSSGSTRRASKKIASIEGGDGEADNNAADTPKPKRGRPRKPPTAALDIDGQSVSEKPRSTRGRKKAVPVADDTSDVAEDEFDIIANDNDDDDDEDFTGNSKTKQKSKAKKAPPKGKTRQILFDDIEIPTKEPVFDPRQVAELAEQYPDLYWSELASANANDTHDPQNGPDASEYAPTRIDCIDDEHPLELITTNMTDQMALTGMALSPDGGMLATFGSSGSVQIWDTETFECLATLRDLEEPNIDEFFVGQFTPNSEYIVVGGKLKDRKRWSEADEDNHILPCPLKVFNTLTGKVVARLEGHSEEILCIKSVVFKGENYFVTTSQDGYIRRWHMDSDWIVLLDSQEVEDGVTCMAFTVSFVPNTANRFFVAATDDHVTLMDLEKCKIVQRFDPIYSSYCDCGKFIEPVNEPVYQPRKPVSTENDEMAAESSLSSAAITSSDSVPEASGLFAYFVTRGVELLDAENNTVSSRPNTCTLHRLVYPTEPDGKFELQEIRRYYHDEYLSNSWLIRITSNGRYILAPTLNGQVFIFDIATGQTTGILRDHDTIEVRDCKFHPTKNLLFTCSDDGTVKAYRSVRRAKPLTPLASAEDVEMGFTENISAAIGNDESDSSQTMAVSPLASLKKGVESLAVYDTANAVAAPDATPSTAVAETTAKAEDSTAN